MLASSTLCGTHEYKLITKVTPKSGSEILSEFCGTQMERIKNELGREQVFAAPSKVGIFEAESYTISRMWCRVLCTHNS